MTEKTIRLERLCSNLVAAKHAEGEAKRKRLQFEDELSSLIATKEEGVDTSAAGCFTVSVSALSDRWCCLSTLVRFRSGESGSPSLWTLVAAICYSAVNWRKSRPYPESTANSVKRHRPAGNQRQRPGKVNRRLSS